MEEYRQNFTEEELKWIKSFERIMKLAPESLFMFVGAGISIFPGRPIDGSGGISGQAFGRSIETSMDYDGGDYS